MHNHQITPTNHHKRKLTSGHTAHQTKVSKLQSKTASNQTSHNHQQIQHGAHLNNNHQPALKQNQTK